MKYFAHFMLIFTLFNTPSISSESLHSLTNHVIAAWASHDPESTSVLLDKLKGLPEAEKYDLLGKACDLCDPSEETHAKVRVAYDLACLPFKERNEVTQLTQGLRQHCTNNHHVVTPEALIEIISTIPNYLRRIVYNSLINNKSDLSLEVQAKKILFKIGCMERIKLILLYSLFGPGTINK